MTTGYVHYLFPSNEAFLCDLIHYSQESDNLFRSVFLRRGITLLDLWPWSELFTYRLLLDRSEPYRENAGIHYLQLNPSLQCYKFILFRSVIHEIY